MDKQIKDLLNELKGKENTRQNEINEINMELKRIDLRQETETDRFTDGMNEDRNAGLYNNRTDGQMQKIIDEELRNIKDKYDREREELNQKLTEKQKRHEEDKKVDYQQLSTAIKDYHLDMVLALNKANKELSETEKQRDEKLAEIDKLIKEKEAERTHLIMKNRNYMDLEGTSALGDINYLGQEIESLKADKETINKEYADKLKPQSETIQYYSEQKERAAKFLTSIRLSEKSMDEVEEILFGKEKQQQNGEDTNPKVVSQENGNDAETRGEENGNDAETRGEENGNEPNANTTPTTTTPNRIPTGTPSTPVGAQTSTPSKTGTVPQTSTNNKNQKVNYKFSAKGIEYDGKKIDINKLLTWHKDNKEEINSAIESAIGDKGKISDFLRDSDKLLYLSIISGNTEKDENGKMQLNAQAKERLEEYYNVWSEPTSTKLNKLNITYNFRGTSLIARLLSKSPLDQDDIKNIKDNAFETRNRRNVTIEDRLTRAEFAIREFFEDKIKGKIKLLGEGKAEKGDENKESTITSKMKEFRNRLVSLAKSSDDRENETTPAERNQPQAQAQPAQTESNKNDGAR